MLNKFALSLLSVVVPAVAVADQVVLRSTDGFISVDGEVVGFNGSMLVVETTVGRVSVPASEVGCYGVACVELVSNNDFGLSAGDIQGVFTGEETSPVEATAPVVVEAPAQTVSAARNLTVSFADPSLGGLYDKLATAYASDASSFADVSNPGIVSLRNQAGTATTALTVSEEAEADIQITSVALTGLGDFQYAYPTDWAMTARPTHQMLGLGALAVIVPENITVDSISMEQLAGIYAGEITNWSELGGADVGILPLQLPAGASARDDLIRVVMEPTGKTIADSVLTMADEQSIAASVNQFPGSISVIGVDGLAGNSTLPVAGSCDLPVAPTEFNIISGDYPLLRPVVATYAMPENFPLVRALFDYAATQTAQDLFAQDSYLSQAAVRQNETEKNRRMNALVNGNFSDEDRGVAAQMFQDLFPAERLSPTMYGGPTSGPEGAWNRAMFNQLADLLKTADYNGRNVLFVGFAESEKGSQVATGISREAASAMSAAFTQFAIDTVTNNDLSISSRGFGSIAPASCYSGQVTINAYSRVEVWVQ